MTAKELLKPRFEVIADYPNPKDYCYFPVGEIIKIESLEDINYLEKYPHLFRKLNWWEHRKIEDMPKKVMSLADDKKDTYIIEEWDMEILVGWIDKEKRSACSLLSFNPEYGYIPVD